MTMRFRYVPVRGRLPAVTLAGRIIRPRPIVDLSILGPTHTAVVQAILDTAADETIFPERTAVTIGLDLAGVPAESTNYLRLGNVPVRYGYVTMRLTDGKEYREWPAVVGFTSAHIPYSLLGYAGALQFFDTLFRGFDQIVEITINSSYCGS